MPSAGGGDGRSSVRRRLTALVAANFVVLVAVGLVGIVETVRAHDSVNYLHGKIEPAARENAEALQDLTDAETYVWAYSITGDRPVVAQYDQARASFLDRRPQLLSMRSLDPQLALLVDDFLLSADNWFQAYAEPRMTGPVGLDTFDPSRFDTARRLFTEVRTADRAVAAQLDALSGAAEKASDARKNTLVGILVGVLVLGVALSLLIAYRIGHGITAPLGALERTAQRLARGEHDARVPVSGPREVVQVATAVNKMADENDRARAVEARVVEQLRALDAVKSDFVSNVSHELRTPLTSILGYLELLDEEVRDRAGDTEREILAAARRNVLRLGELIDDLLALTRSEAAHTELVPLDLAALARDLITDLRVASSQQGVEIRLGLPGVPVPVRADAGQIARVVTNLVSNAVKFSQGASEVVVTVVADDTDAVFSVEDHGIGIPADEMDQLGARFYRASNAVGMGITGTGLGLRIVQAIVENHQGNLEVRSEQGVGTTVSVRIPLYASGQTPQDAAGDPAGEAPFPRAS